MTGQVKKRLGELLIEAGVIDETQLKAALGHQRQWGIRIGQALVDLKLATETDVVKVLAKKFGFEVARLDQVEAFGHQAAMALVPREFAIEHNVFPLAADTSTLSVAMSDPTNLSVVDELRFRTGRRVKVSIGGDREIASAVKAAYPNGQGEVEAIALEIDESGSSGESVMDSFGGGSSDDFASFFGADAAHASPQPGPVPADDPFLAVPAPAPAPGAPLVPASPSHAPFPAPFPVPLNPVVPSPSPLLPRPGTVPLAASAVLPPSAGAPVAPRAAVPVARPAAVGPSPVGPAAAPARAPAVPSAPGPLSPPAAAPARAAAPAMATVRTMPPPGPPPPVLHPAAPGRLAPRPAAVAPPAAAGPRATSHPLEALLSPDAVQAASALSAQRAVALKPPPKASPKVGPLVLELEEELSPLLPEEVLVPAPAAPSELSAGEQAVLDALERLADGGHAEPEVLKPTQAIAVLIRILVRKGIVDQREILDALRRDRPE